LSGFFHLPLYFFAAERTDPIPAGATRMLSKIRKFLQSEDGPTAVEYAVMLALIVIVCLTAINSIGTNAKSSFSKVATSLQSAS
jgi:pilus assembly protein Flp/PilA